MHNNWDVEATYTEPDPPASDGPAILIGTPLRTQIRCIEAFTVRTAHFWVHVDDVAAILAPFPELVGDRFPINGPEAVHNLT
jgi:hypothetical protein